MMLPKTVSILGCGWLGLPLAGSLISRGAKVKGSTTSKDKNPLPTQKQFEHFSITVGRDSLSSDNEGFFETQVLVITLPFKRDLADPVIYKEQIRQIQKKAVLFKIPFVVLTSSTSVYPKADGVFTEDSVFTPDNARSRVLMEIEQELLNNKNFEATVVRLAGLYGYDRQPGRFLSGQRSLEGGESPVNLIHRDDAVGIITEIIKRDIRGEIFNACSDGHPTRKELYEQASRRMGLPLPVFAPGAKSCNRIVSNLKIKNKLGYKFIHPDPAQC